MDYTNRRIAVIGLAVSNTPLIRFLAKAGAQVTVFDKKKPEHLQEYIKQLPDLSLNYRLGEDYLKPI